MRRDYAPLAALHLALPPMRAHEKVCVFSDLLHSMWKRHQVDQWPTNAKGGKRPKNQGSTSRSSLPQQSLFWPVLQESHLIPNFATLPRRFPPLSRRTKILVPPSRLSSPYNTSSRRGFPSKSSSSFDATSVLFCVRNQSFQACHPRLPCKVFETHNFPYFFP